MARSGTSHNWLGGCLKPGRLYALYAYVRYVNLCTNVLRFCMLVIHTVVWKFNFMSNRNLFIATEPPIIQEPGLLLSCMWTVYVYCDSVDLRAENPMASRLCLNTTQMQKSYSRSAVACLPWGGNVYLCFWKICLFFEVYSPMW